MHNRLNWNRNGQCCQPGLIASSCCQSRPECCETCGLNLQTLGCCATNPGSWNNNCWNQNLCGCWNNWWNQQDCECSRCGCSFRNAGLFLEELALEDILEDSDFLPRFAGCFEGFSGCGCQTCATLSQLEALEVWDLWLHVLTHPNDECARRLWHQLRRLARQAGCACRFTGGCCNGDFWRWLNLLWLRERRRCCERENNRDCDDEDDERRCRDHCEDRCRERCRERCRHDCDG
ncbi:MAG: hypothetical protein ACI4O7_06920 [Aristaeellaceae bacterium]